MSKVFPIVISNRFIAYFSLFFFFVLIYFPEFKVFAQDKNTPTSNVVLSGATSRQLNATSCGSNSTRLFYPFCLVVPQKSLATPKKDLAQLSTSEISLTSDSKEDERLPAKSGSTDVEVKRSELSRSYQTKFSSTFSELKSASFEVSYLNALKLADKKSLGASNLNEIDSVQIRFDEALSDLAKIYQHNEDNPKLPKLNIVHFAGHFRYDEDFFSERFQLEVEKQKNLISDNAYTTKKQEIEFRYSQKILEEARPDLGEFEQRVSAATRRIDEAQKEISTLEKMQAGLEKWIPTASAVACPLLMVFLNWRRDRREGFLHPYLIQELENKKADAGLLDLKKEELEKKIILLDQQIEEKRLELAAVYIARKDIIH
jgi:hypothetical protein